MAENSKISWTDHTYNPWRGCTRVSAGCQFCYAETMSKRNPAVLGEWGPQGTRVRGADSYLRKPLAWNKQEWWECLDCGYRGSVHSFDDYCPECRRSNCKPTRQRVFCASLADVFEDRPELVEWRRELLDTIIRTPRLDWLILTKRPENVNRMIEEATGFSEASMWFHAAPHVWMGTSVEGQDAAHKRVPRLLDIPARIRFLSCEPLLGKVDLVQYHREEGNGTYSVWLDYIDLVIAGGESGPNARPMHPDAARSLRDQCVANGVAFHLKQWGEWVPASHVTQDMKNLTLWTWPWATGSMGSIQGDTTMMVKVGKADAGRELDGRIWNEYPKAATP